MRLDSHRLGPLGQGLVDPRRTDFGRLTGLVLGLIVEEGMLLPGYDLDQRQGFGVVVAQNPSRDLGALDVLFQQHQPVVAEGVLHGLAQRFGCLRDGDTDAGAALHRLDHDGQFQIASQKDQKIAIVAHMTDRAAHENSERRPAPLGVRRCLGGFAREAKTKRAQDKQPPHGQKNDGGGF